ncbi:SDR family oxidoreductase, partial [Klebsiella electrica]|uniref:SDR family oxidoreductase n=1 Tax=Klebsiella electrica TaxID=1259973 RepID=UPI003F772F2B
KSSQLQGRSQEILFIQQSPTMTEVADFILFLLSEKSGFCTGGVYPVDGGYLAE